MLRLDRILVARDFSACGERAVGYAVDLARRAGATLHVLYVEPVFLESTVLPGLYDEELEKVRVALSRLGPPEMPALGPERVRVAVVHGLSAGSVICRYARQHDVDLVVTGTHARQGWQRWLHGSVAEFVARRARRSVLVVPTHSTDMPVGEPPARSVIVAVSGVRDARAVEEARSLAALLGARLTVLHVATDPDPRSLDAARHHLAAWAATVPGPEADVGYEVLRGTPDAVIPPYVRATTAGMLVLGPHVRRRRLFERDHVRRLVRQVGSPVYIARPGPATRRAPSPRRAVTSSERPVPTP